MNNRIFQSKATRWRGYVLRALVAFFPLVIALLSAIVVYPVYLCWQWSKKSKKETAT